MKITTTYKTNNNGTGQILAKGMGRQSTVTYDHARSVDANHGIAAAVLIQTVQRKNPELQYGDNICSNVVRSLDAGYGSHYSNDAGTVHTFEV